MTLRTGPKPDPRKLHTLVAQLHNGYTDYGFDQRRLISDAKDWAEREPRFAAVDTFVGTGISGALAVPLLAYALDKTFALVRKSETESRHDSQIVIGDFGDTWCLVDDFVSSGRTLRTVHDAVVEAIDRRMAGSWGSSRALRQPEYRGVYQYDKWHHNTRWLDASSPAGRVPTNGRF